MLFMKTTLTSFCYSFGKRHELITKIIIFNLEILTVIEWCSCHPLKPKCKVNNHHIVFLKDIAESVPNCPHSHHMFILLSDKLLGLLGHLSFPWSLKFLQFPSRTALDVENTLSLMTEIRSLFSFRYLSILAREFDSYWSPFVFLTSA